MKALKWSTSKKKNLKKKKEKQWISQTNYA